MVQGNSNWIATIAIHAHCILEFTAIDYFFPVVCLLCPLNKDQIRARLAEAIVAQHFRDAQDPKKNLHRDDHVVWPLESLVYSHFVAALALNLWGMYYLGRFFGRCPTSANILAGH
jgi:hypothetical protein